MKSLEIICCLFIIIFALAVAHPLPDNVLEQVEAKQNDGGILPQESVQSQVLPSPKLEPSVVALLFMDTTAAAEVQKLTAGDNASSSDISQDNLQKQQDPEAVMFSEEALEAIFNDTPQERELQKEE